jgi:hypothetical protein
VEKCFQHDQASWTTNIFHNFQYMLINTCKNVKRITHSIHNYGKFTKNENENNIRIKEKKTLLHVHDFIIIKRTIF